MTLKTSSSSSSCTSTTTTDDGCCSRPTLTTQNNDNNDDDDSSATTTTTTTTFEQLKQRLHDLELWKDLAVRPKCCHPDDQDLYNRCENNDNDDDDNEFDGDFLKELSNRCLYVRQLMNAQLPILESDMDDTSTFLKVQPSTIPNAGMGLFYMPPVQDNNNNNHSLPFPQGHTLCYYYGHIHTYQSAQVLVHDKSYLMCVQGNVLVDPGPLLQIKARYINDPINTDFVNCRFVVVVPSSSSSSNNNNNNQYRTAVVATRSIQPGEELFVSYGPAYWSQPEQAVGRAIVKRK